MWKAGEVRSQIAARLGTLTVLAFTVAGLSIFSSAAHAAPFLTYGASGSSSVFAVSCSGPGDGGLPNGNIVDNRIFFKAGSDCTGDPLTTSASSSFTSGNVNASGLTNSGLGAISGSATMSTDAQSSVRFPAGFTDAGWIDTLLLENAGTTGQLATVSVILNVSGVLSASGPNVVALLQLAVSSEASGNPALHQPLFQIQAPAADLLINEALILDLPFVVGTPSQFLVRAMARAMTSSQTSFGNNTSGVNFLNTVSWGGIDKVMVGGNELTSFTATGVDSGIDWALPVPEPGTGLLLSLGLVALATRRERSN